MKQYNYHNIKNVLEKGLDSLRGFKGEIRLSAKFVFLKVLLYFVANRLNRIGKVFWSNVPVDIKGQIWKYEDINDIIIKEHLLKPQFTRV